MGGSRDTFREPMVFGFDGDRAIVMGAVVPGVHVRIGTRTCHTWTVMLGLMDMDSTGLLLECRIEFLAYHSRRSDDHDCNETSHIL